MSNKAVIEQRTVIPYRDEENCSHEVFIFDNHHQDSIGLDEYARQNKKFKYYFDDDMELLKFVVKTAKEEELGAINEIMDYVQDHQNGIEINGKYYQFEEIASVFSD